MVEEELKVGALHGLAADQPAMKVKSISPILASRTSARFASLRLIRMTLASRSSFREAEFPLPPAREGLGPAVNGDRP
jgi:hypothetical protein